MNPTTATTHAFKAGDVVKRREGNNNNPGYRVGTAPFSIQRFDGRYATDSHGDQHSPESLELVAAAAPVTTGPRPYQVGDVVRRGTFGSNYTITRIDPNGTRPQYYGGAGGWDYANNITLVTPVESAPPALERKLGETPAFDTSKAIDDQVIAIPIDDPRIAWIWKDLATYADGKRWCTEYDRLAAAVGIPGRKKKFGGWITVAGQRVNFTDVEADSQAAAQVAFRKQLAAELAAA